MDNYGTLTLLLDSLFKNNYLQNWSLYEETDSNNYILVKLRFTKKENAGIVPQSYRRRSEAQSRRDRDRAARHRARRDDIVTRSRSSADVPETVAESVEMPRNLETNSHSDTMQLEHSPVVQLNPGADSFVPESVNLNRLEDQCADLNDSRCIERTVTGARALLFEDTEPKIELPDIEIKQIRETSCSNSDNDASVSFNEELRCEDCFTNFRSAVNVYNINMTLIRLLFLDTCHINVLSLTLHNRIFSLFVSSKSSSSPVFFMMLMP